KISTPDDRKTKVTDGFKHPIAELPVNRFHTAGMNPDQDTIRPHPRNINLFDLQDLRTTVSFRNNSFHRKHSARKIAMIAINAKIAITEARHLASCITEFPALDFAHVLSIQPACIHSRLKNPA